MVAVTAWTDQTVRVAVGRTAMNPIIFGPGRVRQFVQLCHLGRGHERRVISFPVSLLDAAREVEGPAAWPEVAKRGVHVRTKEGLVEWVVEVRREMVTWSEHWHCSCHLYILVGVSLHGMSGRQLLSPIAAVRRRGEHHKGSRRRELGRHVGRPVHSGRTYALVHEVSRPQVEAEHVEVVALSLHV